MDYVGPGKPEQVRAKLQRDADITGLHDLCSLLYTLAPMKVTGPVRHTHTQHSCANCVRAHIQLAPLKSKIQDTEPGLLDFTLHINPAA
jgi:hypothetical protein